MSKIIESLRANLAALHEVGAVSKVTMRELDAICPPPVREFGAAATTRPQLPCCPSAGLGL